MIRAAVLIFLIVAMDIVAGILGILAEVEQNKAKHIKIYLFFEHCRAPSHDAFKLGLAAALILVIGQVITNVLGGCVCVCSKDELERASANKLLAVACLFLSWITLVIGFSMLIIGAFANSRSEKTCRTSQSNHHFLFIGGILCFFHGLFGVAYCISAKSVDATKPTMGEEEEKGKRSAHTGRTQMAERGRDGPHSQP